MTDEHKDTARSCPLGPDCDLTIAYMTGRFDERKDDASGSGADVPGDYPRRPDMIGPIPFRLNQGTARKWRSLLVNTPWAFDAGQLSFKVGGKIYGSPEGLLASIACPEPDLAWDGVSHLYEGAQFFLTPAQSERLKLRGTLPDFPTFDAAISMLDEMAAHHGLEIR